MDSQDKNSQQLSAEDLEALRKIQQEEERLYGKPNQLPLDDEFDPEAESLLDNSEAPVINKQRYYGLQSIVCKNIPKGKIRDFVNNEKKLYLKSISESGDSRFSFKNSLNDLFVIADKWQRGDKNGFELGMSFYDLNESLGFHNPKNIDTANRK